MTEEKNKNKKEKDVVVYSTPSCKYCVILKDYLEKKGVKYKNIDVSVDQEGAQEMVQRTGQMGVPVTIIDDNVVIGFNEAKIEFFLNEDGQEKADPNVVKVYSTPTCMYCIKVKDFFKENNINFEDVNVAEDQNAGMYIVNKTGQMGVPVIETRGEFIIGFDEERLREILDIK